MSIDQKCQTAGLAETLRHCKGINWRKIITAQRLNLANLPNTIKSDHDLFTFFNFCYLDGCSEYKEEFDGIWGQKIIDCSYSAPVIANFSSAEDSGEDSSDDTEDDEEGTATVTTARTASSMTMTQLSWRGQVPRPA